MKQTRLDYQKLNCESKKHSEFNSQVAQKEIERQQTVFKLSRTKLEEEKQNLTTEVKLLRSKLDFEVNEA